MRATTDIAKSSTAGLSAAKPNTDGQLSNRGYRVIQSLLIASIAVLGLGSNSANAAPEHGKKFKDWQIACEQFKDPEGKNVRQCHMFQAIDLKNDKINISLEKPDGKALRLLTFQVGFTPGKPDQVFAILTTPLGTSLRPGLRIKIDENDELRVPFERCMNVGCKVVLALDNKMLSQLRKGSKARVQFHDLRGKGIALPASLSGFTAALRSLK